MGKIEPIEGSRKGNGYFIEYDEDQWNRYDEPGKEYCYDYWKKKAGAMDVAYVALRLIPDPIFPAGAQEKPYIAWQHMFPVVAEVNYTTKTIVHVTLETAPTPKIRHELEGELRKTHPKGTVWRAYWDSRQCWNGRV